MGAFKPGQPTRGATLPKGALTTLRGPPCPQEGGARRVPARITEQRVVERRVATRVACSVPAVRHVRGAASPFLSLPLSFFLSLCAVISARRLKLLSFR